MEVGISLSPILLSLDAPTLVRQEQRRCADVDVGSPALRAEGSGKRALAGAAVSAPGHLDRPALTPRARGDEPRRAGGRSHGPARVDATQRHAQPLRAVAARGGARTRAGAAARRLAGGGFHRSALARAARLAGPRLHRAGGRRARRLLRRPRERRGAPRRDLPGAGASRWSPPTFSPRASPSSARARPRSWPRSRTCHAFIERRAGAAPPRSERE